MGDWKDRAPGPVDARDSLKDLITATGPPSHLRDKLVERKACEFMPLRDDLLPVVEFEPTTWPPSGLSSAARFYVLKRAKEEYWERLLATPEYAAMVAWCEQERPALEAAEKAARDARP